MSLIDNYVGNDDKISLKTLKLNLKEALKKSGVLDNVKAQIRKEFITGLSSTVSKPALILHEELNIRDRITFSSLYHFLLKRELNHTVSVFVAECGIDVKSFLLSESDIVQLLHLENLQTLSASNKDDASNKKSSTLLDSIIDAVGSKLNTTTRDSSTQSDSTIDGSSLRPRELLESQMRILRQSYSSRRDAEMRSPSYTVEERMIAFHREC